MGVYTFSFTQQPGVEPSRVTRRDENFYWGGRLVHKPRATVPRIATDRLGSTAYTFPYGEFGGEVCTAGGGDKERFATCTRDERTGLDYADQRYYSAAVGRFGTVDPSEPPVYQPSDTFNLVAFLRHQYYIGTAISNSFNIAQGTLRGYGINGEAYSIPTSLGRSSSSILLYSTGNNQRWGIYTSGKLKSEVYNQLNGILNDDVDRGVLVPLANGRLINST